VIVRPATVTVRVTGGYIAHVPRPLIRSAKTRRVCGPSSLSESLVISPPLLKVPLFYERRALTFEYRNDGCISRHMVATTNKWPVEESPVPRGPNPLPPPMSAKGQVSTPPRVPIPDTEAAEIVDVSLPCRAHVLAGSSQAHFKMVDEGGRFYFPDRYSAGLVLAITVVPGKARLRTEEHVPEGGRPSI
jgi:hypothetical protein